ncbi:MAG: hypothetical protein LIR46_08100 [Bacteroidota bacterium]|nr:hypothetical protein [Bacteroidota bacterium]
MKMTIDEHKEHLLDIMDSMPDDACGDWRDSLAYAIDTMRKYQKIKAYMKKLEKNGQYGTLRKLKIALGEVEDENDD